MAVRRALQAHERGENLQRAIERELKKYLCELVLQTGLKCGEVEITGIDPDGTLRWS